MAGILIPIVFFVGIYTVFAPVLTLEGKHLKRGLVLLLLLGVLAFVLHLAKMV